MNDEQLVERLMNINKNYELPKGVQLDIRQAADRIKELIAELKLCAVDMFEAEDKFHVLSYYISEPQAYECAISRVEWFEKANDRIQKVLN